MREIATYCYAGCISAYHMRGGLKSRGRMDGRGGGGREDRKRGICERQSLCERTRDDRRSDRRNVKKEKTEEKHARKIELNTSISV